MNISRPIFAAVLLACFLNPAARAESGDLSIGQPAPEFTAVDSKGVSHTLSEYRGKPVVLEWTNADCPFTRKHYSSGNMQSVQALARRDGVVWLSVISSAPGKQGYVDGAGADALTQKRGAAPAAVLLDPTGTVAHLATTDVGDIATAEPYLKEAMLAVVDNKPVPHPVTKPYGCSIKYPGTEG
jgi:hypothetical protein